MINKLKRITPYLGWIVVFEAISFASARMTNNNIDSWYATLTAPPLVPPNWVFPVAWSILYAMIGCAGYRLWRSRDRTLLGIFGVYMLLNWSWSFVYFGMHRMGAGLIEILAMDLLLITLVSKCWVAHRTVALLLLPLMAWSLFATYLNAGYWFLN